MFIVTSWTVSSKRMCSSPNPQDLRRWQLKNRVFAEAIVKMRSYLHRNIRRGSGTPLRRGNGGHHTHTQREITMWQWKQTFEGCIYTPRNSKDCCQAPEVSRRQAWILLYSLQREQGPAGPLTSGFKPRERERINFWCCEPPNLWYFITALGNLCIPKVINIEA